MNNKDKEKPDIVESIRVFVRLRPEIANDSEETITLADNSESIVGSSKLRCISSDCRTVSYYSATNQVEQRFAVDKFFDAAALQDQIYEEIASNIVSSALDGYSGTILAYGPTGSGKTYTMRGGERESRGIMPRCIESLLSASNCSELWASYLQIYCETVHDLLVPVGECVDPQALNIREKSDGSIYVEGLSKYRINSPSDLWELLARGDLNRSTAATNMNETSSRSHAILMVNIITKDPNSDSDASYRESTLMLVDLAGSERAHATAGRSVMRMEEAKCINLSLSALGNCMNALATLSLNPNSNVHVPYRDSKLTRLLQGCLGGSSRTSVVVTLAPGTDIAGESLSALRFASRASKVKVTAKVSKYRDYEALYKELKTKLKDFESSNVSAQANSTSVLEYELKIEQLQSQLADKTATIQQQALEISTLQQKLNAYQSASNTVHSISNKPMSDTATTSSDSWWQSKMDTLVADQVAAIESLHRDYQYKLSAAQANERKAFQQVNNLQDDIKAERERTLSLMKTHREAQSKRFETETAFQNRISELLAELESARDCNEDLRRMSESGNVQLVKRIAELENQLANSVSKDKVAEMESLFLETVTKLSNRVKLLEEQRIGGSTSGVDQTYGGSGKYNNSISNKLPNASMNTESNSSKRDVRLEPGGKVRANSTFNYSNNNNNSNNNTSNGNNSGNGSSGNSSTASIQYSQSTSKLVPK